jgi:hypothetical protein
MKRVLFIAVLFFMISVLFVSAKDLYVDQNSVNGQCSEAFDRIANNMTHPWCTISRANLLHLGGDTIYILPGTYHDSLFPKTGSVTKFTEYIGVGDRTQIIIKGSNIINTSWTQCTSGCPSTNIYYTTFVSHVNRSECYRLTDPPVYPINASFDCGYDGSSGNIRCSEAFSTDCWEDETGWLIRSDLISGSSFHYYSRGLSGLNSSGKFYYDYENSRLYVWTTDSQSPEHHIIECSARSTAPWSTWARDQGRWVVPGYATPSYVKIQNLTIMHSFFDGFQMDNSHDITIQNNEIMHNSGQGSCAENPAAIIHTKVRDIGNVLMPNVNIIGNKIHDQGSDKGRGQINGGVHSGAGIEFYSVKDSVIENNEIYMTEDLIHLKSGWDPVLYQNITIRNNTLHDGAVGVLLSREANETKYSKNAALIVNNLIYSIGGFGILTNYQNNNTRIFGNTIFKTCGITIGEWTPEETTSLLYNNIVMNVKVCDSSSFLTYCGDSYAYSSADYNLYYNTTTRLGILDSDPCSQGASNQYYYTLASWQTASGKDYHSQISNPQFFSTGSNDFRLQNNSPAIDNATVIFGFHCQYSDETAASLNISQTGCRHWCGSAPDIGAFEYCAGGNNTSNQTTCVDDAQLAIRISSWYAGSISISQLIADIKSWKQGC